MRSSFSRQTGIFFLTAAIVATAAVPSSWEPRGIGGGGSLFSPSINPANPDEFYVACDMSELFHTTDFGASFSTLPFYRITGGNFCSVRFTSNNQLRYAISYVNDQALPVKSIDGGATWNVLAGNPDASEGTYSINADYSHPERVVISYYGSAYFSKDGGGTFTNIHTAPGS